MVPQISVIMFYMMAGFYCTVSPFIKLNSKVVFISLFWFLFPSFGFYFPLLPPLIFNFSGKEHTNLTLIILLEMTFGCQTFWG